MQDMTDPTKKMNLVKGQVVTSSEPLVSPLQNELGPVYCTLEASKKHAIALAEFQQFRDWWIQDKEIWKVKLLEIEANPHNCSWAFWSDNYCPSWALLYTASIFGPELIIKARNKRLEDLILDWNEKINSRNETIETFFRDSVIDSMIFRNGLWAKQKNPDIAGGMALNRLDPRTLHRVQHDTKGWEKWIQLTWIADQPLSKSQFYSKKYEPALDWLNPDYDIPKIKFFKVHIPSEQVVKVPLYRQPPIRPIIHIIIYKKWIQQYLKIADEKFATPTPTIKVGTDKDHPTDKKEYETILKNVSQKAANWKNWDAWAYPWNYEIGVIERARTKNEWIDQLNYLDEQIIFGLSGSIALIKASGAELATSRTIQDVHLRGIEFNRRIFKTNLRRWYKELARNDGLGNITRRDLDIRFIPTHSERLVDLGNLALSAYEQGVLDDWNETRRILSEITGWDLDRITDPKEPLVDRQVDIMKAQPQPILGGFADKSSSTSK